MDGRSLLRALLSSLAVTLAVAFAAVLYAVFRSASVAGTGGIGAVAGGVSETFLSVILVGLPLTFLLSYLFIRGPRKPWR